MEENRNRLTISGKTDRKNWNLSQHRNEESFYPTYNLLVLPASAQTHQSSYLPDPVSLRTRIFRRMSHMRFVDMH